MVKNKLKKFTQINTFSNVVQPGIKHPVTDFSFKGLWNNHFFRNDNPILLEIGCGKGEYTLGLARQYPDKNFIGIDIKGDRIWKGAKEALEEGLYNVAFLRIQAERINYFFDKNEVSGIWITFPDPQPRESRKKKRLSSQQFLKRYHSILKPFSPIHLKTDSRELFDYTREVIHDDGHTLIYASADIYNEKIIPEPLLLAIQTYYEDIFLSKGLPIHYLEFHLGKPESNGTSFFSRVYEVVRRIPNGRVSTYGAIASYLGAKGSARMVGWAMNQSHHTDQHVPAHRVVNRHGMLTGRHHFGSSDMMKQLLENENITVEDNQVMCFKELFWDPAKER